MSVYEVRIPWSVAEVHHVLADSPDSAQNAVAEGVYIVDGGGDALPIKAREVALLEGT